jgi:hypothetical protein
MTISICLYWQAKSPFPNHLPNNSEIFFQLNGIDFNPSWMGTYGMDNRHTALVGDHLHVLNKAPRGAPQTKIYRNRLSKNAELPLKRQCLGKVAKP